MITPEVVGELVSAGRYWWMNLDSTFVSTETPTPPTEGAIYLLDADENWVTQWDGDWQAAVDSLEPLLTIARSKGFDV